MIIVIAVAMVLTAYNNSYAYLYYGSTNTVDDNQLAGSFENYDIASWNNVLYNLAINPDYVIEGSYGFYTIENYFDYGVYIGDTWLYQTGNIEEQVGTGANPSSMQGDYALTITYKYDRNQNYMNVDVSGTSFQTAECITMETAHESWQDLYVEAYFEDEDISDLNESIQIIYTMTEEALMEYSYSDYYRSAEIQRTLYNTAYVDYIWIAYWFVVIGALLLPLMWRKKSDYETYEFWRVCKLPLEIVALIYVVGHFLLLTINMDELVTGRVPFSVHIVLFTLFYSLVFWAVTNVRAILTMGMTYFTERCLLVKFWGNIKVFVKEQYQKLIEFDLRDKTNKQILRIVIMNFIIVAILTVLWGLGTFVSLIYSIGLFLFLKKHYIRIQDDFQEVLDETSQIAAGYLDINLEKPVGSFTPIQEELRGIQTGFKKAVEEEVKSVNMKTELISNVSHDLKTPLTAIITYVDLLKNETDEEKRKKYIEVLEMKSNRLKRLIEDLFEVSKASSKNVTMNYANVDVVEILKQVSYEYEENFIDSHLEIRWNLPEEKQILSLDGEKTYRVFENLLLNITKYALPHTRVYIEVHIKEEWIHIIFRNISAEELNLSIDNLTNRFVRGDESRNTEGSGLGLAIAKSFVELQGGKLLLSAEADLFKAEVMFHQKV